VNARRPAFDMPLAESQGKRHANNATASLQSEVSCSVPSPGHDKTNFSQVVVPCA